METECFRSFRKRPSIWQIAATVNKKVKNVFLSCQQCMAFLSPSKRLAAFFEGPLFRRKKMHYAKKREKS